MVCGLYEPWSGEVFFDGRRRHDVAPAVFATSLSLVDQDIAILEGTVHDNHCLWDSTIPVEVLASGARDANFDDVLAALPGGLKGRLSEGGNNLSGGQRQQVEIARALAADPRLLVLDEATSVLDVETEQVVAANLCRSGCACLVIAHRLSTIREVDGIYVLDQGSVEQCGTFNETHGCRRAFSANSKTPTVVIACDWTGHSVGRIANASSFSEECRRAGSLRRRLTIHPCHESHFLLSSTRHHNTAVIRGV